MFDFETLLQTASTVIATWVPKVVGALAVLFLGWIFAGWAKRFSRKTLRASRMDEILIPFLSGVIHVGAIVMVAVTAIGVLGISTS